MKIKNGTIYAIANPETERNLRKLGHKVVADKKKLARKNACRKGGKNTDVCD